MGNTKTDESISLLWNQILRLLEENLAERRGRRVIVGVPGESGTYQKEIGELSVQELRSLDPGLREHVGEQLLDRYLAEQSYIDLIERERACTKKIQDLTPSDLPALVEADRYSTEEMRKKRDRERFVQEVRKDLDRLCKEEGVDHPLWKRTRT